LKESTASVHESLSIMRKATKALHTRRIRHTHNKLVKHASYEIKEREFDPKSAKAGVSIHQPLCFI